MVFFNNLGGRIKNAGQNIAQSTRNFADVAKLKKNISDNERQIAGLYAVIGKTYYERHKDDSKAEDLENILKINSLFKDIDELKQQIKEIEGFVKCPGCGCDVPADAAFCNHCGAKIPKETEHVTVCPSCGKVVPDDSAFCNSCGCKIVKETEAKTVSDNVEPVAEDVPAETKTEQE